MDSAHTERAQKRGAECLSDYELLRNKKIRKNNEMLKRLGVTDAVSSLSVLGARVESSKAAPVPAAAEICAGVWTTTNFHKKRLSGGLCQGRLFADKYWCLGGDRKKERNVCIRLGSTSAKLLSPKDKRAFLHREGDGWTTASFFRADPARERTVVVLELIFPCGLKAGGLAKMAGEYILKLLALQTDKFNRKYMWCADFARIMAAPQSDMQLVHLHCCKESVVPVLNRHATVFQDVVPFKIDREMQVPAVSHYTQKEGLVYLGTQAVVKCANRVVLEWEIATGTHSVHFGRCEKLHTKLAVVETKDGTEVSKLWYTREKVVNFPKGCDMVVTIASNSPGPQENVVVLHLPSLDMPSMDFEELINILTAHLHKACVDAEQGSEVFQPNVQGLQAVRRFLSVRGWAPPLPHEGTLDKAQFFADIWFELRAVA